MSHTDLIIFFSGGTWVFFFFLLTYFIIYFYLLPYSFFRVGFRNFVMLKKFEVTVRKCISKSYVFFNVIGVVFFKFLSRVRFETYFSVYPRILASFVNKYKSLSLKNSAKIGYYK